MPILSHETIQLLGGVVSVLVLLGGAIWWCLRWHIGNLRRRIRGLEQRKSQFERKLDQVNDRLDKAQDQYRRSKAINSIRARRIAQLEKQFEESFSEKEKWRSQFIHADGQLRRAKDLVRNFTLDKADLETRCINQKAENHNLLTALSDRDQEILSLTRQLTEVRTSGEIDMHMTATIESKEKEHLRLTEVNRLLEEQVQKAQFTIDNLKAASFEQDQKIELLNDEIDELKQETRDQESSLIALTKALEKAQTDVNDFQMRIETLKKEYEDLTQDNLKAPGRIWERPTRPGAPEFFPLAERQMPIISVINLKGGVGKTTLSANLAATLGNQGKRVLLIDLDYQRSLSKLCLEDSTIQQLFEANKSLQHFLMHSRPDAASLLRGVATIPGIADDCGILINAEARIVREPTDSLEDVEMFLQAKWLINPAGVDARLILRKALHAPAVHRQYDYVILDCPPRLSTACINGLAASDFALVPVLLDPVSSISAPNLLRKLNQIRSKGLLSSLDILGIVGNHVKLLKGRPVRNQLAEWEQLPVRCRQAWGSDVHFFKTMVKASAEFSHAANRRRFAASCDELKPAFTDLTDEILARITNESCRVTTVSA